jgi:glycosyltransferase involved in cell wall biosynthesis
VEPKDTGALEQAILTLAENGMLRRAFSEAARKRMREEFSIDAMVDQHIELYASLLNGQANEQRHGRHGRQGQPDAS